MGMIGQFRDKLTRKINHLLESTEKPLMDTDMTRFQDYADWILINAGVFYTLG
ncbi:hypothetical protein ACNKHP_04460 [Shigella boydii]